MKNINHEFIEYNKDSVREMNTTSGRASSIITLKARTMVNMFESIPFNIGNEQIKTILDNSDFISIRRKLGMMLSFKGTAMLALIPIGKTFIVEIFEVVKYSKIGIYEQVAEGLTNSFFESDGVDYQVTIRYEKIDGKIKLSRYIFVPSINLEGEIVGFEKRFIETDKEYIFKDIDVLPVKIFSNNEDNSSDISYYGVESALNQLSVFDSKVMAEWNRTRTQPYYNNNFSDLDAKEHTKNIDNGKGYTEEDGYASKVAPGYQMLPATGGLAILQSEILFMEDDIYKKLVLKRDAANTGTNKHGLEILLKDEDVIDEILSLRNFREKQWNDFFNTLSKVIKTTPEEVKIKFTRVFETKLQFLDITVTKQVNNAGGE